MFLTHTDAGNKEVVGHLRVELRGQFWDKDTLLMILIINSNVCGEQRHFLHNPEKFSDIVEYPRIQLNSDAISR